MKVFHRKTFLLLLIIICLFFLNHSQVFANKLGINIAARHEEFDQAADLVGPGGWVVVMASPGNADELKGILTSHPEVNIILRGHCPSDPLGPDVEENRKFALSWVATLGSLDTAGRKIFFMPWNEPNMTRECGDLGDDTNPSDTRCAPFVQQYITDLKRYLSDSGLLSNKVELLSPMINQHHPNYSAFINALGGRTFFEQFYGVTMNLYDNETCGGPLCQADPLRNAGKFNEALNSVGLSGLKIFAAEMGIVDKSGTCPSSVTDCPFFEDSRMNDLLSQAYPSFANSSNFTMFSPLSYNPETNDDSWIYNGVTAHFYTTHKPSQGNAVLGSTPANFESWRNTQGLTTCQLSQSTYILTGGACGICSGSKKPNIALQSETTGGEKIVHKKSWLIQALEVLHLVPVSGKTSFSNDTTTNLPDFQPVSKTVDDSKNSRLLPAILQKKLSRNSSGEVPAEVAFPNCNAARNRQNTGKSTTSIISAEDVSNSLVLNDLLNSTSKNNSLQRKINDPMNYVVEAEKPINDEELYNCSQVDTGETVNSRATSLNNEVTKWSGEFNEGNGVLAAETGPTTSLTPTPVQRQATLEIVNQAKTRTYLTEIADAFSGSFGFLSALIPSGLNKNIGLTGKVKNSVTTESDSKTQKDLDIAVPRAGEMIKTADLFKKMLLPSALQ